MAHDALGSHVGRLGRKPLGFGFLNSFVLVEVVDDAARGPHFEDGAVVELVLLADYSVALQLLH